MAQCNYYTMPFTPYHFGFPLTAIGVSLILHSKRKYHLKSIENVAIYLAMLAGSVIPDLQGFYSVLFNPSVPLHGFSHTIFGAISYSLIFSTIQHFIYKYRNVELNYPLLYFIWFGSIVVFHIIPDMFIYPDLQIFAPFSTISIGKLENYSIIASILSIMWLIGIVLILIGYSLLSYYEMQSSKTD